MVVVIETECFFEAAHRQFGDPSKCGRLHGHNWKAVIAIKGGCDSLGYIVDFKDIKTLVDQYDHAVLLCEEDPLVGILRYNSQVVISMEKNPTCENLCESIADDIATYLNLNNKTWKAMSITLWENHKSKATFCKRNDV